MVKQTYILCAMALCWTLVAAAPVSAQHVNALPANTNPPPTSDAPIDDKRAARLWHQHWRPFAAAYVEVNGAFYHLPGYNNRFPSSLQKQSKDIKKSFNIISDEYFRRELVQRTKTITSPDEDLEVAVKALPEFEVGHWGTIHGGEIVSDDANQIQLNNLDRLDPDQLASDKERAWNEINQMFSTLPGQPRTTPFDVRNFAFFYRDQLTALPKRQIVLRGFDRKIRRDVVRNYASGPFEVAIVEDHGDYVVGVPVALFKRGGLKQDRFEALLTERGLDRVSFAQLFVDLQARGRTPGELREAVFAAIQDRKVRVATTLQPAKTEPIDDPVTTPDAVAAEIQPDLPGDPIDVALDKPLPDIDPDTIATADQLNTLFAGSGQPLTIRFGPAQVATLDVWARENTTGWPLKFDQRFVDLTSKDVDGIRHITISLDDRDGPNLTPMIGTNRVTSSIIVESFIENAVEADALHSLLKEELHNNETYTVSGRVKQIKLVYDKPGKPLHLELQLSDWRVGDISEPNPADIDAPEPEKKDVFELPDEMLDP